MLVRILLYCRCTMPDKLDKKPAENPPHNGLGRAFLEAGEMLAEQPRRMAEEFRELGRKYEKTSRKIAHGIRRTNGKIG